MKPTTTETPYFPELNLLLLKSAALVWARRFPFIVKIFLYRAEESERFVIVFDVNDIQAAQENWLDDSLISIQGELTSSLYSPERQGRKNFLHDWIPSITGPGYPLGPELVREDTCYLLYDRESQAGTAETLKSSTVLPAIPEGCENYFVRSGKVWFVGFKGEKKSFPDTDQLRYIAILLAHEGREIPAVELYRAVTKSNVEEATLIYGGKTEETLRAHGRSLSQWTDQEWAAQGISVETARRQSQSLKAMRHSQRELTEMTEEYVDALERARESGDLETIETAQENLDVHIETLQAHGYNWDFEKGRLIRVKNTDLVKEGEKTRVNCKNQINKARKKIAEEMPLLGAHLFQFIHPRTCCSYLPDCQMRWHVSGW
jgi:hypothetical protein